MCSRRECIRKIQESAPYLRQEFGVERLCLFGSMARGDNRPDSDIDIFVEMPPKAFKVVALKNYLQNMLGAAIDLVRKHSLTDNYLLQEINRDGINII